MADRAGAVSEREQKILGIIETARGKRAKFRDSRITMAHGAGGKATQTLIEGLLAPAFASDVLNEMADAGAVQTGGVELAMTTDSYVVKPLRFPGGSIGELAVNGTVNDLAVSGARPLAPFAGGGGWRSAAASPGDSSSWLRDGRTVARRDIAAMAAPSARPSRTE